MLHLGHFRMRPPWGFLLQDLGTAWSARAGNSNIYSNGWDPQTNTKIHLQMSALSVLVANFLVTVHLILLGARRLALFLMTSMCPS